MIDSTSTSGFIVDTFSSATNTFTDYTELPSNGYNAIFKAKRYGKWYILKGLKPEFANNAIYIELLTKEFDMGILLEHPNIVRFVGKEIDPIVGRCIIMEFVDGVTLNEFIAEKHSRATYDKIIGELLNAMLYFHSKQLIHRDLKPSNILITRNGDNVKIIDFGLSDTDYHSILKQPAGSPKFAAPEQWDNAVTIDNRADLYAFGMILKTIFGNRLPQPYKRIAQKCTQADREKRYQSAGDIIKQIGNYHQRRRTTLTTSIIAILLTITGGSLLLNIPKATEQNAQERIFHEMGQEIKAVTDPFIDSLDRGDFLCREYAILSMQRTIHALPRIQESYLEQLDKNDTQYQFAAMQIVNENFYLRLENKINEIPFARDLYENGKISEEEYNKIQKEYSDFFDN